MPLALRGRNLVEGFPRGASGGSAHLQQATELSEEFLIGQNDAERLAKVADQIVRITTKDYYHYRIGALSELITRHTGGTTSLLELGAGFGYNLFSLSLDPRWTRLRGLRGWLARWWYERRRRVVREQLKKRRDGA